MGNRSLAGFSAPLSLISGIELVPATPPDVCAGVALAPTSQIIAITPARVFITRVLLVFPRLAPRSALCNLASSRVRKTKRRSLFRTNGTGALACLERELDPRARLTSAAVRRSYRQNSPTSWRQGEMAPGEIYPS